MKEETRLEGPFEFGVKPVRRSSKTDWEEVLQKAKDGQIDQIPADIQVKHYNNLKKIERDNMPVRDFGDLRGIWIYGISGVGKSRYVREHYGDDLYPKPMNKWWDAYRG